MARVGDGQTILVELAAEGMAPAISGCAKTLPSGLKPLGGGSLFSHCPPAKAIDLFGPQIIERWLSGLSNRSPDARRAALVQLAAVPMTEIRQQAKAAVE